MNDVLRSNGHTQVDVNDERDEINIKDCDGDEDKSIDKKEYNSDELISM